MLDEAESKLNAANDDLDHGEFILKRMANPFKTAMFHHSRNHHENDLNHSHHNKKSESISSKNKNNQSSSNILIKKRKSYEELEQLSAALDDLELQCQEISSITDSTTEKIIDLKDKSDHIHERLEYQTKQAKIITQKGTIF